jgi:hypothetical protein
MSNPLTGYALSGYRLSKFGVKRKAEPMTIERSNAAYDIYLAKTANDDAAADAYAKQVRDKQYAMTASGEAPEADAFIMAVEAIG